MTAARSYLFMALHVSLAACTYVLAKSAAVEFPDAASLTMARGAIAAGVVLALTGWAIPRPRFRLLEWAKVAALGALLVPCNQYVFVRGLKDTVPSHPALLYALTPVVVLVLSAVIERRSPPRSRWVGVAVAFVGVLALLRPWEEGPEVATLRRGDLWIGAGVLIWAVYTIAARRLARRHDPRVVTAWALVFGALFFLPLGAPALLELDVASISARGWLGLVWLGVVTSTLMMLLWNAMLAHLEPVQVAICANAQPVVTALLAALLVGVGWLSGDQDLGLLFWCGTALVLCGVWIVQRRR